MTQQNWIYVAWFQDTFAKPDDEDREWVAVIAIACDSAAKARAWGDHLARKRRADASVFLRSEVHLPTDPRYDGRFDWRGVPCIACGEAADDARLGW